MLEALNPCDDAAFAGQNVAYTGTAGAVTGWAPGAPVVLVWCTTDAYVVVGEGVTATSSHMPIPARTFVAIRVPRNVSGVWRVSAIRISADGTMYCKPAAEH